MSAYAHDINLEFGVGFEIDPAEDAFPSSDPMPQFLPSRAPARANTVNLYPPMLLHDLALGLEDSDTICDKHGITPAELEKLFTVTSFKRELSSVAMAMREEGKSFKAKTALLAEQALERVNQMIYDSEVPHNIVLQAIQCLVKWGGLEPKPEKADAAGNTQAVQININIPNYA